MKKLLIAVALVAFVSSASISTYAASASKAAISKDDKKDDKKCDKKCKKDCAKACCNKADSAKVKK